MLINHYLTLGTHAGMDDLEIKAAYRAAARTHHPDRGGDPALFDRVMKAYAVTGTAAARAKLAALYALRAGTCARCGGCGYVQRTARGFASVQRSACPSCHGCGYNLGEKDDCPF